MIGTGLPPTDWGFTMRHLRTIGRAAAGLGFAAGVVLASPPSVAAECPYIPPLPKVSMAIPTAKELFVGEVIANGASRAEFTVRIDEVLRGPAKIGDLRAFHYLEPNWPWAGPGSPSCSSIYADVGEHLIVALGARTSGRYLHEGDTTWYQPPTTFNTIGITEGSSREQYGSGGRQLFSLTRLRELAGLSPPATDTLQPIATASATAAAQDDIRLVVLTAGGLLGAMLMLRRTRQRR